MSSKVMNNGLFIKSDGDFPTRSNAKHVTFELSGGQMGRNVALFIFG